MTAPGSDGDLVKAEVLVHTALDYRGGPSAVAEALAVIREASGVLVRTERFQVLHSKLTPRLAERYWHFGPEVERFLAANDPERIETHSLEPAEGPWYEVTNSDRRLVYRGASSSEAHAIARAAPGSMLVGSRS